MCTLHCHLLAYTAFNITMYTFDIFTARQQKGMPCKSIWIEDSLHTEITTLNGMSSYCLGKSVKMF